MTVEFLVRKKLDVVKLQLSAKRIGWQESNWIDECRNDLQLFQFHENKWIDPTFVIQFYKGILLLFGQVQFQNTVFELDEQVCRECNVLLSSVVERGPFKRVSGYSLKFVLKRRNQPKLRFVRIRDENR